MEGFAKFQVPGIPEACHTWYKVFGDVQSKIPLIVLHGGPGACHDYLIPLTDLTPFIPLVFYDQIGNGRSTHLPDKAGDEAFWSIDLFKQELDNLIEHLGLKGKTIDVYGHSWGGMLAMEWAASPSSTDLRRLILSNSLASINTWQTSLLSLRKQLPRDVQEVLDRLEGKKDFDNPEYQAAVDVFYQRHFSLVRPWPPKEVQTVLDWFSKDSTVYNTMYGPTELYISGSLRDWSSIPLLSKIKVPTLLINGTEDESQDVTVQPLFQHIEKAKWITLDDAAHFSHVDRRESYMKHVASFLADS